MADFELLAPGGHQELVDEVLDRLDTKADYDGYYAQLTAGAADSLTGRGDGVSASYLYRTTGGDADVADGTATVKSIHGRTVVWNQLMQNGNFASSDGWYTDSSTISVEDNVLSMSPSESGLERFAFRSYNALSSAQVVGHKYLLSVEINPSGVCKAALSVYGKGVYNQSPTLTASTWNKLSGIMTLDTATNSYTTRLYIIADSGTFDTSFVAQMRNFHTHDLTAMFGAGNEPSTVAEFEALYPEPYYPYDAGSLLSVQTEGIETVGFNQWDEEYMTSGYFRDTDGAWVAASVLASKNPIPVFPSTTYYLKNGSDVATYVTFWENPHPAGANAGEAPIDGMRPNKANSTFTTPANCRYIHFNCGSAYGTTYNHDICVNLSWSDYRNGEYEPYWKSERTIPAATYFPNGMRSAGTVYDELTSDEAVTRVGAVDLGNQNWSKSGDYFYTIIADKAVGAYNIICSKYPTSTDGSLDDGECIGNSNNNRVSIMDTTYTDAASFKDAMSGVMLHYALATPTTQPIDPPLNLTYRVSDFGTERIMHTDPTAAPTQQVVYGLNVVDTVRRLPTEYISHDSFTQFTNALATFLDATITESWDATDGRYEYTITQNGE